MFLGLSNMSTSALPNTLVGASQAMKEIYHDLALISQSKATVLLRGESGTGKELLAKLIYENSPRSGKPFIKVNCAALSESLIESELFGHEKGAFTGAIQKRVGRFELADGGTIFLDEVGDLPLSAQVKLLRVLQEMSFERVGGMESISVDLRVIAATHRNLERAIVDGLFRQDLYYRLNVVPVYIPPLRERREDIPILVNHFVGQFNLENEKRVALSSEVIEFLSRYDWPGNVRELENCMERLVVLSAEALITLKNIPHGMKSYFNDLKEVTLSPRAQGKTSIAAAIEKIEQEALQKALERCGWVQAKAARLLGFTPRQVAYKIRKYHLTPGEWL